MLRLSFALACGAALPLAFAPYDFAWLAIPAIAGFFAAIAGLPPRQAALGGWLFGLGMFGHGVWWIQVSVHKFGLPVYSFSVSVTALFVAFMALYPAVFAYLVVRWPSPASRFKSTLVLPGIWVLLEWLRGFLFTGFPWLNLGYSQLATPFGNFAPLLGAYGVSYVTALAAGLCLAIVAATNRQRVILVLAVIGLFLSSLVVGTITWVEAVDKPYPVALVQGAVPQELKWRAEVREPTLELYQHLTEPHWDSKLIVWPETAIPAFAHAVPGVLQQLRARAQRARSGLLTGIPIAAAGSTAYYNSVLLLGREEGRFDKRHLVPFGEYLPFDRWLRSILNFLSIPMSSFSPGAEQQALIASGPFRIGVSICYEDAYASEIRQALPTANILVNVSDDAWFGDTVAPHQHLQIAQMRAREMGRYLLRATNTGISAIIDHHGRIIARAPQFEAAVLRADASVMTGTTPFARYGQAPIIILVFAALSLNLVHARHRSQP